MSMNSNTNTQILNAYELIENIIHDLNDSSLNHFVEGVTSEQIYNEFLIYINPKADLSSKLINQIEFPIFLNTNLKTSGLLTTKDDCSSNSEYLYRYESLTSSMYPSIDKQNLPECNTNSSQNTLTNNTPQEFLNVTDHTPLLFHNSANILSENVSKLLLNDCDLNKIKYTNELNKQLLKYTNALSVIDKSFNNDAEKKNYAESNKLQRSQLNELEKQEKLKKKRAVRMFEEALEIVRLKEIKEGEEYRQKRLVQFHLKYSIIGGVIHLVGSTQSIGGWDVTKSIPMKWVISNLWILNFEFSIQDQTIEYKYIIRNTDTNDICWEPGKNHKINIRDIKKKNHIVYDTWGAG